ALFESTSYDRVMAYKFLDDLSGEVIYEIKNDDVVKSSFLGMRFPAGDIPLPARNAYIKNPVRFIADVEKPSCHLLQKNPDIALSRSFLRGCVFPHQSYLRAMGVRSSLSIAITSVDGGLWGLVTMHSYSKPMVPKIEDRVSYSIFASVVSSHVQHIEEAERRAIEKRVTNLVSQIDTNQSLGVFIVQNKEKVLETFNVDSVSLFTPEGLPTTVGENGATLEDIPIDNEPLVCGSLKGPIRSFACLSVLGYKIVFTRVCSYEPISWAGDPKALGVGVVSSDLVMPRQSFDKYMDHKSQNPPPFTKQDRLVFLRTGDLLKSIIHRMKLECIEKKVAQAKKHSDTVETKSDENYAFFANMSHELRTPLHAINGVLEIIHDLRDVEDGSLRRYTAIGLETCKDMMKTLNSILAIVRQTHEGPQIDVSLVLVKEIFSSTSNGLRVFAAKNGVSLDISLECETDLLVRVDAHKTTQIFNNVGGNAIKFTSGRATGEAKVDIRVHVLGTEQKVRESWAEVSGVYAGRYTATECWNGEYSGHLRKWLVFQTRDDGCGIHLNDMPKVFNKFTQVGDVVTKAFASTGLGLHISMINAKTLGGFLSVASTPDKGSLFFCAIPIEAAGGERETITHESVADPAQGLSNDEVVFVVVDDSKVNLMIAKKQIEREFVHATVYTAANGKLGVEEVERLENEGVDIDGVLMDYHMPIMSGLEATRQIKRTGRNVPVTMLTADITEISRQSMLSSGADLVLLKPSRPREVVEVCAKMIQLKRS
ncbi:unnamed protein product, partial [Pylaiella littoralis]